MFENKSSLSVSVKRSRVQKDTFSSGESMICYASSKIDKKKNIQSIRCIRFAGTH